MDPDPALTGIGIRFLARPMVHKQGFIMLGYSQRKDSSAPIHFWTISSAFRQDNLFASLTRASHHDFSPLHVARGENPQNIAGNAQK